MDIKFFLPNFKLFPYEKELLKRELLAFTNKDAHIDIEASVLSVNDNELEAVIAKIVKNATYIDRIAVDGKEYKTMQGLVETTISQGKKRQATRYLSHGIHEYRGKFNPQIARSILNILKISAGKTLFDPFCGSGTTLLESARLGVKAFGCDINPLASFITTAKIKALYIDDKVLIDNIFKAISWAKAKKCLIDEKSERYKYLLAWIPEEILCFLESYRNFCEQLDYKEIYLTLASNLIRDYSYQEPSDLRIRRRISPFPDIPFEKALFSSGVALGQSLKLFSEHENLHGFAKAHAEVQDIRSLVGENDKYDVALTSPPYATALPYIDTHRISMVWLRLIKSSDIRPLEESLVGSREMTRASQSKWINRIEEYRDTLPNVEVDFCLSLVKSLGVTDGFRRKAVPPLLLRYFYDMHCALKNVLRTIKSGGTFALVVGTNKTTLGGEKFEIDTPNHIVSLGLHAGWKLKETIPLQTYQRYGLHSKNGIHSESLLLLEAP